MHRNTPPPHACIHPTAMHTLHPTHNPHAHPFHAHASPRACTHTPAPYIPIHTRAAMHPHAPPFMHHHPTPKHLRCSPRSSPHPSALARPWPAAGGRAAGEAGLRAPSPGQREQRCTGRAETGADGQCRRPQPPRCTPTPFGQVTVAFAAGQPWHCVGGVGQTVCGTGRCPRSVLRPIPSQTDGAGSGAGQWVQAAELSCVPV